MIPLVSTNDTHILSTATDTIILLPVNNNYTAIITYTNTAGPFNVTSIIPISKCMLIFIIIIIIFMYIF